MTLFNRDVRGRRVQLIVHVRVFSDGYSVREWFEQAFCQRGRGYYPRRGEHGPIFRYWLLGPVDLRVFT